MDTEEIIQKIKEANLYAECPYGEEFNLSKAILFDGTKPFPKEVLEIQAKLKGQLVEKEDELKKRIKLVTEKAAITTKAVNVGKNLEKVLPTMKDFKWELPDSRFLGDPIDLITFNGLSAGNVNSISFIEVKSGNARLNDRQKSIKTAIERHKLVYKVFK
jgi:predicted Holliday junction resolvase-like endonuclease